ncbi:MAG: GNAT family N-acetyltransferase [Bacteroidia bacterium]|nr:GNAT family N-acetyltransferase [Bacteroidia bacterium]
MIREISAEQTYPLRSEILRWGKVPPEQCANPEDALPGSFHLGYFEGNELVGIASFHVESMPDLPNVNAYRLRGMAVAKNYQNKGIGKKLIQHAIALLKSKNVAYLWCNARTSAMYFYEKMNFEVFSEEFDIPNIGPHYRMRIKL